MVVMSPGSTILLNIVVIVEIISWQMAGTCPLICAKCYLSICLAPTLMTTPIESDHCSLQRREVSLQGRLKYKVRSPWDSAGLL
jgi:hypothetical protein